jgi:hypothetical protein
VEVEEQEEEVVEEEQEEEEEEKVECEREYHLHFTPQFFGLHLHLPALATSVFNASLIAIFLLQTLLPPNCMSSHLPSST